MEFKNCPFCGSEDIVVKANYGRHGAFVHVACLFCGSQGKNFSNKRVWDSDDFWNDISVERAINAWNMRTGDKGAEQNNEI